MTSVGDPSSALVDPLLETPRDHPNNRRIVALGTTGFVASVLLALVGNSGAPRAPGAYWHWVPPFNGRRIGVLPALHVDQLALIVLVLCWVALGVLVRRGHCSVRQLFLVSAVWAAPLLLTPPLFSDDIYDYVAVGALQVHHLDPYLVGAHSLPVATRIVGAVSPAWSRTPTPYGPGLLLICKAAARLSGTHDIVAVTLLRLLAAAALLACGLMAVALARDRHQLPQPVLWLLIANPLILVTVVGGGHNDVIMMAVMLAGYFAYRRSHPLLAQLALAAAAEIKVVAVAGMAVLAVATLTSGAGPLPTRLRASGRQLLTGVASFAVLTSALGLTLHRGLLGGWGWIKDLNIPGTVLTAVTPTDAVYGILGGPLSVHRRHGQAVAQVSGQPLLVHLRHVAIVVFILIAASLTLRIRRFGTERLTGLILLSFALLGQVLWPWYLIWPLCFLALAGSRRERLVTATLSVALLFIDSPGGPTLFGDAAHIPHRGPADLITVAALVAIALYLCVPDRRCLSRQMRVLTQTTGGHAATVS